MFDLIYIETPSTTNDNNNRNWCRNKAQYFHNKSIDCFGDSGWDGSTRIFV